MIYKNKLGTYKIKYPYSPKGPIINFGRFLNLLIGDYNRMTDVMNNMYAHYNVMDLTKEEKKKLTTVMDNIKNDAAQFFPLVSEFGKLLIPRKERVERVHDKNVTIASKTIVESMENKIKQINDISKYFVSGFNKYIKYFSDINR